MYTHWSVYIEDHDMPRHGETTKHRIINAAYDLFYKGGFAAASVDAVAAAAGVTKRTFYYHFDSKQTLVAAALDLQHELSLARIERWAARVAGDPAAMVDSLFAEFAAWLKQARWRGSGFTRAAMEFARSPGHPARIAARRHKAAVERCLAERFEQHGVAIPHELARQVMLLMEGCQTLVLIHGDPTYAESAARAARVLVESQVRRPDVDLCNRTATRRTSTSPTR
jgi:AcrR family transcriptional regulator